MTVGTSLGSDYSLCEDQGDEVCVWRSLQLSWEVHL